MRRFERVLLLLVFGAISSGASAQEKKIRRDRLPPAVERPSRQNHRAQPSKDSRPRLNMDRLYEVEMFVNGHHKDGSMES